MCVCVCVRVCVEASEKMGLNVEQKGADQWNMCMLMIWTIWRAWNWQASVCQCFHHQHIFILRQIKSLKTPASKNSKKKKSLWNLFILVDLFMDPELFFSTFVIHFLLFVNKKTNIFQQNTRVSLAYQLSPIRYSETAVYCGWLSLPPK